MSIITTSSKYGYISNEAVWEKPHASSSFAPILILLEVQAASDAHIWLSAAEGSKSKGYEILLGGWKNKRSEIRRGQQGTLQLACLLHEDGQGPLCPTQSRKFWISLISRTDSVTIVVGKGWEAWKDKLLVGIDKSSKRVTSIESVNICTGFGAEGKWSIVVSTVDSETRNNEKPPIKSHDSPPKQSPHHDFPPRDRIQDTIIVRDPATASGQGSLLKRKRSSPISTQEIPHFPILKLKASRDEKIVLAKYAIRKK